MPDPHGSFIWYELITPDPDGAKLFYDAVLGWEVGPASPEHNAIARSEAATAMPAACCR